MPDYSKIKRGVYEVGGHSIYFDSSWEYVYACALEKRKKLKIIKDWKHEPRTFFFTEIKHGTTRYTPDFMVEHLDGSIEWHEVKGYMDAKSKTKLRRMAKYYPNEKLVIIDKKSIQNIKRRGI
jgi:hypothetical protein